jgi:hypothetical protein
MHLVVKIKRVLTFCFRFFTTSLAVGLAAALLVNEEPEATRGVTEGRLAAEVAGTGVADEVTGLLADVPGVVLGLEVDPATFVPRDGTVRVPAEDVGARVVVEPVALVTGVLAVGAGDRLPSTEGLGARGTAGFTDVAAGRVVFAAPGVDRPSGAAAFTAGRGLVAVVCFGTAGFVTGFLVAAGGGLAAPGAIPRDARVDVLFGFSDIGMRGLVPEERTSGL